MEINKAMQQKLHLTLLVSHTESLQSGLLALFTTLPQIGAVLVAEENDVALRMVKNHMPSFVILDMALPNSHDMIGHIKANWASLHLIALVEEAATQTVVKALGADSVLLKGFSAEKLLSIVDDQIKDWGEPSQDPEKHG